MIILTTQKKINILYLLFFALNTMFFYANTTNLVPKKINIYWDNSLSMQNKDLEKEIAFLDNYLVNIKEVEINLIVFSNTISLEKKYQINNANWADLKEILLGITYDGMALYENIGNANSADINLLFTDGFVVIDKLNLELAKPTYIISSSKNAKVNLLKRQSNISNANYINLSENNIKEALLLFDFEPNKILLVDDLQVFDDKQLENNAIQGIVYNNEGVLIGAEIKVKGKSIATTTNENGKFLIHANKGDVLEIKYLGMETRDLLIVKLKFYDVLLLDKNSELDEIVLEGAYKDPTENTGYGEKDKEKIGYAVQSVSGEDLSLARPDNIALQGKFSGVTAYGQNDDISQMLLRGNSFLLNLYPLIVLDGTPLRRSNSVTGNIQVTSFISP